jgi:predicted CXXCH cytochrome family protein
MLMSSYDIETDPHADYVESVHGKALLERGDIGAPACNDCHGSHGAAPPGVDAVQFVCGTCHLNNREQFKASPHATAFSELDSPECITCHGYHLVRASNDASLGVGERGICRKCHTDKADAGHVIAARLGAMVDSLRSGIEAAREITDQAEQKGMLVDDPTFQIRVANEHLVKMRTLSHAVSPDALAEDYQAGMGAAEAALADASARIEEFRFRRRGLAVASLLNTLLIGLVVVGIRRLARRKESAAD